MKLKGKILCVVVTLVVFIAVIAGIVFVENVLYEYSNDGTAGKTKSTGAGSGDSAAAS